MKISVIIERRHRWFEREWAQVHSLILALKQQLYVNDNRKKEREHLLVSEIKKGQYHISCVIEW